MSQNKFSRNVAVAKSSIGKRKAILQRIQSLEKAIRMSLEYLETGKHEHWRGFRPLFNRKVQDGKELPPHKDWVRNFFLPRAEKALSQAEKLLERLAE